MRRETRLLKLGIGKMSQMLLIGVGWAVTSVQWAAGNVRSSREDTSKKFDQNIGIIISRIG